MIRVPSRSSKVLQFRGSNYSVRETKYQRELASEFKMEDLGLLDYFLRLEVWQRSDEIVLSQGKYAIEILTRFNIMDYKSIATPM